MAVQALNVIIDPGPGIGSVYRSRHPIPVDFIDRILLGIPDGSFPHFLTHFANRLSRHDNSDQLYGGVSLIAALFFHAKWHSSTERELLHALANSNDLFALLLSRIVASHDGGKSGMPSEHEDNILKSRPTILQIIASVLPMCTMVLGKGIDILTTLVASDIFGILEAILTEGDLDLEQELGDYIPYYLCSMSHPSASSY